MKKAVITGATGFIGVHLIDECLKNDTEVFAIVRPNSMNIKRLPRDPHFHVIELDMNQYFMLPGMIPSADIFYHLAWEGARLPYRDDVVIQQNNYDCAIRAFETAVKLGCQSFLGSGSQAEYGSVDGIISENHKCLPYDEYGKQKLNACIALSEKAAGSGMRFIWTRIFSIYGPFDYPGTLVMQCIDKMTKNLPIEMTEGTQLWDYLFVADAARAMYLLSNSSCDSGVYHIASGRYKPLCDYVKEIKTVLASSSEIRFGAIPYGPKGPINLMPDISKLKQAVNWGPDTSFADGIRKTFSEMKKKEEQKNE